MIEPGAKGPRIELVLVQPWPFPNCVDPAEGIRFFKEPYPVDPVNPVEIESSNSCCRNDFRQD